MWELMIRVKFRIPFDLPLVFLSSSSSLFSANLLHKDWVLKKEKHHTFCRQREVRDEMKEQTRRENKNHCFLSSSSMMRCVASENCCTINGPWSSRFASQKAIEEERRKSERKVWNRETRHGKKERKSSSFCTRVVEIQETSFRDWRKTRRLTSVYTLWVFSLRARSFTKIHNVKQNEMMKLQNEEVGHQHLYHDAKSPQSKYIVIFFFVSVPSLLSNKPCFARDVFWTSSVREGESREALIYSSIKEEEQQFSRFFFDKKNARVPSLTFFCETEENNWRKDTHTTERRDLHFCLEFFTQKRKKSVASFVMKFRGQRSL